MPRHLSSKDLEKVMAGTGAPDALRHVHRCAECSEEVQSMRAILAGLRISAVETADRQRLLAVMPKVSGHYGWLRGGMWAGAMAAVLVAAVVPVEMMHRNQNPHETRTSTGGVLPSDWHMREMQEKSQLSDEALLDGVQSDLSSTVPAPLEPLAGKTTTSSATTNAGNTKE